MTGLPSFNLTAAIEKIAEPVWNDFAAHLRTASPNEVVIAVMVEKRECVEDLDAIMAFEQHVQFVHSVSYDVRRSSRGARGRL